MSPAPRPAEAGPARISTPRRTRPDALAAFERGALPWGERPGGAPEGRGVRVFVVDHGSDLAQAEAAGGLPDAAAPARGRCGDDLGNGRAITAVIRRVAPAAEILTVRILARGASTPLAVLEGALEHAIRWNARVVGLGVSIPAVDDRARARALCGDALRRGVVLIAAAGAPASRAFPAEVPEVIGAVADARLGERSLRYARGAAHECRASGWPWPPPPSPCDRDPEAHRLAAARVASAVACILEARPRADLAEVRHALEAHFSRRS